MSLIVFHKPVGIFGKLKEISLFLCKVHLAAAVGAFAVFKLSLGPKGLAGGAVVPLIVTLVYVALFIELFKNLLHRLFMVIVGGADEFVVGNVEQLPEVLYSCHYLVHILLGRNPLCVGLLLDFKTVLIGTGKEHRIKALHSFIPRHSVGRNGGIRMADVQLARRIVNRRGNVKCLVFHINSSFLEYSRSILSPLAPYVKHIIWRFLSKGADDFFFDGVGGKGGGCGIF